MPPAETAAALTQELLQRTSPAVHLTEAVDRDVHERARQVYAHQLHETSSAISRPQRIDSSERIGRRSPGRGDPERRGWSRRFRRTHLDGSSSPARARRVAAEQKPGLLRSTLRMFAGPFALWGYAHNALPYHLTPPRRLGTRGGDHCVTAFGAGILWFGLWYSAVGMPCTS